MEQSEGETLELVDGEWRKAIPIQYFPSLTERFLHRLGVHCWTYSPPRICLICGKVQPSASS